MTDHLPALYERFSADYPAIMHAFTALADEMHRAGPMSDRERRLVKLGIAIGGEAEGAVRSHARKARREGIGPDVIRQAAVLAITTAGYPAAMAGYGWINEVLDRED